MTEDARHTTAREFEAASEELELAARHLRRAAQHFRNLEVPRGCAHAFAAEGHMFKARQSIDQRAIEHAAHSQPGDA